MESRIRVLMYISPPFSSSSFFPLHPSIRFTRINIVENELENDLEYQCKFGRTIYIYKQALVILYYGLYSTRIWDEVVPVEGKIREFTRYYFEENYTSRDNKFKKDSILSVTRKVVSKKIFQKSTTEATMSCFDEERKKKKKGKEEEKNNRPRYTFRIVFHRAAINSMDRGERRREVRADGREEREGKWKLKAVLRIKSTSRR